MKRLVGILGMGEVGTAIKELAEDSFYVYTRDLDHDEMKDGIIDILHVCLPYSDQFVSTVIQTIREMRPWMVIINSTVPVGTTRKIHEQAPANVVHCPIMGIHPNLAKSQKVFTKAVGTIGSFDFLVAKQHWLDLGAPEVVEFSSPENTELAKLLSTTYYGWNIIFNKFVHSLTKQTNTNFDEVYTRFNRIYNEGYRQIKPEVIRPVLEHVPGPIGGHCVIPNIEILYEVFGHEILDWMLQFNQELEDEEVLE